MRVIRTLSPAVKFLLDVLIGLSLILLTLSFLNRDTRLLNQLVKGSDSEFQSGKILCGDFPACFRITSKLFGRLLDDVFNFVGTKIFFLEPTNTSYTTAYEKREILSNLASVSARFILVLPLLIYLYKLVNRNSLATLVGCISLASIISAYPLVFVDSFFDMYLTLPDYGSLFIVGLFLLQREKLTSNMYLWILFNSIAVLTFENLGFVFAITLYFVQKKSMMNLKKYIIVSCVLSVILPAILIFIELLRGSNSGVMFPEFGYYGLSNLNHFHKLLVALALIFVWPFLLGALGYLSLTARHSAENNAEVKASNYWVIALLFGFLASYFVGLVNSGLASEGARQTLAGQLLFFLIGLQHGIGGFTSFMQRRNPFRFFQSKFTLQSKFRIKE